MGVEKSNIDVNVQDQTTKPLDLYFLAEDGAATTLSTGASAGDYDVVVTAVGGFTIGETIVLLSAAGAFYIGEILGISTNTLSLDSPLDSDFIPGSDAVPMTKNMNVDGSSTPVIFKIRGDIGSIDIPIKIDITRIMFQIISDDPAVFDKFGDIENGLTRGIVLRRNNGVMENIFNVKTNGDLSLIAFDTTPYDSALPTGVNGLSCRYTFAGKAKHGVTIRLDIDESLDLIIQDDLQSLVQFRIMAQGHVVS